LTDRVWEATIPHGGKLADTSGPDEIGEIARLGAVHTTGHRSLCCKALRVVETTGFKPVPPACKVGAIGFGPYVRFPGSLVL